jgi:hypothetical protein
MDIGIDCLAAILSDGPTGALLSAKDAARSWLAIRPQSQPGCDPPAMYWAASRASRSR